MVASRELGAFRIVFGPVYHPELAHRALNAMRPRDPSFGVHRREIRAQHSHYNSALSSESALLRMANFDPLGFSAIVEQGVANPIVVATQLETQLSLAIGMGQLAEAESPT